MYRILVALSEEAMRILFAEELVEEGYDVTTCGDLPRLLELLEQKQPDLVILNSALGPYNSLDLLRLIRRAGNDLPVLLCVNQPVAEIETGFSNMDYYEHNSSSLKGLKGKVRKLIGRGPTMKQVRRSRPRLTLQAKVF